MKNIFTLLSNTVGVKKSSNLHSVLQPYYHPPLSNCTALLQVRTVRTTALPFLKTYEENSPVECLLPKRKHYVFAHNLFDDGAYIEVPSSKNVIVNKYSRSMGCW